MNWINSLLDSKDTHSPNWTVLVLNKWINKVDITQTYLGDGGLRVEYEVAKCPLENPSELREEASGVGDGSEGSSSDHLLSLDDPLWDRQKVATVWINLHLNKCSCLYELMCSVHI